MGGTETVLVVEDQPEVQRYAAAALREYGYHVITAETAGEALSLCSETSEPVHLVLTDVVMPNLSGQELAIRLRRHWPKIKVLFMSGHPPEAVVQRGAIETDAQFIQKPFSPEQLAIKIREALGNALSRPVGPSGPAVSDCGN